MNQKTPQNPKLRPHEVALILKILKTLSKEPKNTLAIYRALSNNSGFRNHHSFYRQLHFCLQQRLIELAEVNKKWGIPTKTYRLTEKGVKFLEVFKEEKPYTQF